MIYINTVGIVAEYNPFHKGHLYQINEAKRQSGAKNVVAVMSGNFVQRGDFAICSKWARAEMAVKNGVNLVVELPCVYSCQTAEVFARGAVDVLNSLKIVDCISFGIEDADEENIIKTAEILNNESDEFKRCLAENLNHGLGFPAARSKTLQEVFDIKNVNTPNNILAVEYARAILQRKIDIKLFPVKRVGNLHDDVGSASYIRELILKKQDYSSFVPENVLEIISREEKNGMMPISIDDYNQAILYRLRNISKEDLSLIADVSEGLENRIIRFANECSTVFELTQKLATKRYSNARIRRIIVNALLNITKEDICLKPQYIKVLAADSEGRKMIKMISEYASIPVIIKMADAKMCDMLKKEIAATSVYSLGYKNPCRLSGNAEFVTSPYVLQ